MTNFPLHPPLDASRLALGSWHVFSRLSLDEGAALVQRAIDLGITLFDVGDYWDHELSNETRFAEIVKVLGLKRDQYRIGIKVFTNSVERRADLVRGSLDRLEIDQADYIVCSRPSGHETMEQAVEAMSDLVTSGLTQDIAVSLWTPEPLIEAVEMMRRNGLVLPKFIQLQYNVCRRSLVESEPYRKMFSETRIAMQAADTLEGGILAGHLHRERFNPEHRHEGQWFADRNIPRDSGGIRPKIRNMVPALRDAAARLGVTPPQLAIAFCLLHERLDTVLFGATCISHLEENLGALELARSRPEAVRDAVAGLAVEGAAPPPIFDVSAGLH